MWQHWVAGGLGAWAAALGTVGLAQRRLIFAPPRRIRDLVRGPWAHTVEPLRLHVGGPVWLEGWQAMSHDPAGPRGTLVYFGGRHENVAWAPHMASHLRGWRVVAYNHRGFGGSTGVASSRRVCEDALRILHRHAGAPPQAGRPPRVVMGRSLGSGVAVWLAAQQPLDALVLVSPFDSLSALVRRHPVLAPGAWLLRERFDSAALAPAHRGRTLVVLAPGDTEVPNAHSLRLAERFGGPTDTAWLPGLSHRNLPRHPLTQQCIAEFLAPLGAPVAQQSRDAGTAAALTAAIDARAGMPARPAAPSIRPPHRQEPTP